MFSIGLTGTTAQQYLHRARMFRSAAMELVDYVNGEPNWPKYALLTHAIELALKAFARHSIENGKLLPPEKEPKQHDLHGWYRLTIEYGLLDEPSVAANISTLNELHRNHYTRYPQARTTPVPAASNIADDTVDHLISAFTRSINTG